jgi:(2Fe-2S) ferredoxin
VANTPELETVARGLGIGKIGRHIFLCADQTKPKCSTREESTEAWEHLKKRLAVEGAMTASPCVYRTKANCLRVCEQGPIAVVYPEGVWYHSVRGEALDRIIDEHLMGGRVVEELVFARSNEGTE